MAVAPGSYKRVFKAALLFAQAQDFLVLQLSHPDVRFGQGLFEQKLPEAQAVIHEAVRNYAKSPEADADREAVDHYLRLLDSGSYTYGCPLKNDKRWAPGELFMRS